MVEFKPYKYEHALSALKVPSSHVIMSLLALVYLDAQNRIWCSNTKRLKMVTLPNVGRFFFCNFKFECKINVSFSMKIIYNQPHLSCHSVQMLLFYLVFVFFFSHIFLCLVLLISPHILTSYILTIFPECLPFPIFFCCFTLISWFLSPLNSFVKEYFRNCLSLILILNCHWEDKKPICGKYASFSRKGWK